MKARLIFATFLLIFAGGAALAQSYQIRVTWPVRLRASYSLDSPVVGKALAGDVLNVVGRHNRWLKIERDGETAWLADWVDYTRLDQEQTSSAEPAANERTPSDIDNCCFVNRQCATDQEWVDGYWAYQGNECPGQPQSQSSSASVEGHDIRIEAAPQNLGFITEALNRLRAGSQKWYDYVINVTDLIREDPNSYIGGVLSEQRIILIAPYGRSIRHFDMDLNLVFVISLFVHEACHIHRHDAGFPYNGYTKVDEEAFCINVDNQAIREIAPQYLHWMTTAPTPNHCEGDLTNHPSCRFLRENCEWSADNRIISCPAIGLTRPSN